MGRVYTVPYSGTPSATVVPWELTAPSGRGIRLLGFNLAFESAETDEQIALTRHALAALTVQPPDALDKLAPTLSALRPPMLPTTLPAPSMRRF